MTSGRSQYCGECFELFDSELAHCPRCGKTVAALSYRDYQQKLAQALEHPLADVRMWAIIALGLRGEGSAAPALVDCALRRPADVVEGLETVRSLECILVGNGEVGALMHLAEAHPAHAVRLAAKRALENHPPCPFCPAESVVLRNELACVRFDIYPVNPGHCLIIPFRHVANYFDITKEERQAMLALADEAKKILDRDFAPQGYNLGINVGDVAGQTVPHVHLHLIPRYLGDVENPRGGVRGVIPARQHY